ASDADSVWSSATRWKRCAPGRNAIAARISMVAIPLPNRSPAARAPAPTRTAQTSATSSGSDVAAASQSHPTQTRPTFAPPAIATPATTAPSAPSTRPAIEDARGFIAPPAARTTGCAGPATPPAPSAPAPSAGLLPSRPRPHPPPNYRRIAARLPSDHDRTTTEPPPDHHQDLHRSHHPTATPSRHPP